MNKAKEISVQVSESKRTKREYRILLLGLTVLLIGAILAALCIGRYMVPVTDVVKILSSRIFSLERTWEEMAESVVYTLRLPRVIGAVLVGGALALSGSAYQGVFKNPLVSPDLLGVSSGACVGAAIAILFSLGSVGVQVLAFIMGIVTVGLTVLIPKMLRNTSITMLVLSGVIVRGIMDSVMGIIKYLADPETQLASITYWQMGSLTKVLAKDLLYIGPVILAGVTVIILLRWRINILSLGDQEARALGVPIGAVRGVIIFCATLLTASSVCICGTIGWVGLVIPHLGRMITGPDNTKSIPVSMLLGAVFMLFIDTLARVLTAMELPLSILTGLIGAPFYIIILAKQRMRLS
ncbi:MAG: FecCD family ABC transporter permease [Lachnospiraceae bacterium]|jgi:iron complex transport system permease protein